MDKSTAEELVALEKSLLTSGVRTDQETLMALLADEFVEFGASGTVYNKQSMISGLLAESDPSIDQLHASDMQVQLLHDHSALVTYRINSESRPSLRSSVWTLRDGRWQILFHQGTRVAC